MDCCCRQPTQKKPARPTDREGLRSQGILIFFFLSSLLSGLFQSGGTTAAAKTSDILTWQEFLAPSKVDSYSALGSLGASRISTAKQIWHGNKRLRTVPGLILMLVNRAHVQSLSICLSLSLSHSLFFSLSLSLSLN
jgi:hypothetical protein